MFSRRKFVLTGTLTAAAAASPRPIFSSSTPDLEASLAQLEKDANGRLGVAVLDTASGKTTGHRTAERFPMCSTFKMLLAAAVLHRVDSGREDLSRTIAVPSPIVLTSSPITKEHAGSSMTLRDLCLAAVTRSDNTAANLLLDTIGGPSGITSLARSLGDPTTRLDRIETSLNEGLPGDPRDTTSPAAMVADWQKLLLGNDLSPASRQQLTNWLIANKTGDDRIRAGLPSGWRVGDKTGSNGENTTNDVAILWPTSHPPILVAAYLTQCPGTDEKRNAVLAQVGRLVAKSIQST